MSKKISKKITIGEKRFPVVTVGEQEGKDALGYFASDCGGIELRVPHYSVDDENEAREILNSYIGKDIPTYLFTKLPDNKPLTAQEKEELMKKANEFLGDE